MGRLQNLTERRSPQDISAAGRIGAAISQIGVAAGQQGKTQRRTQVRYALAQPAAYVGGVDTFDDIRVRLLVAAGHR